MVMVSRHTSSQWSLSRRPPGPDSEIPQDRRVTSESESRDSEGARPPRLFQILLQVAPAPTGQGPGPGPRPGACMRGR